MHLAMVISKSDQTKSTTAATIINYSGIKLVIHYTKSKQIFGAKIQSSRQKWMTTLNSHFLRKKIIFFLTLLSRIVAKQLYRV